MSGKATKITANIDGLATFVKQFSGQYVTRVGVLGDGNARADSAYGNAEIGLVHEFGSISRNIPKRSFLRQPLELKSKDFMRAMGAGAVKDAIKQGDIKLVYSLMGAKAEAIIQDAFATGGFGQWEALTAATVKAKGSNEILKNLNELRRSVTSDVVNKASIL